MDSTARQELSVISGPSLSDEPGLGALTLPGFLREVTAAFADREALAFTPVSPPAGGVLRWSYTELWENTVAVARALRACGVGKGTRVGVLMTNRPEWITSVFGTALAGGVAVTLSTFSTAGELDYLLGLSGVSVLLFERNVLKTDFAAMLSDLGADGQSVRYPFLRHLAVIGDVPGIPNWETFLASGADEPRAMIEATAAAVSPSDVAVLFFSSGSTSKPKGILSAHRGVCIQMWRFRRMYGFTPDDMIRCWAANGFFWSGNFAMSLATTLACGGSLILQPTFIAAEALELMQNERVNFPFAWPHQWAQLEAAPNWGSVDLSSVRYVDQRTPVARHPSVSSVWFEPSHAYGNTETFTISTCYPANTPAEIHADSSGVALPGVTIKIVDPVTGVTVALGERGEICVKGPTLMLGYVGVPLDETLDAEGFFPTGDGGYIGDGGRLYWEGRLTEIIKTGGANVSPLEVDTALAGYPGVKMCKTVGVDHDTLGEVVVACVVAHEGVQLDGEELRAFLRERLASYKVPRHVLFFDADVIEQTGTGKMKTGEFRQLASDRLAAERLAES